MPISSSWPIASALWALGLVALLAIGACSMTSIASAIDHTNAASNSALTVQTAVTRSVRRWSDQLVTAYHHRLPTKWTPPAVGVTRHGLQVFGIALNTGGPGGTWVLEDLMEKRVRGGVLLPDTSDSIAVRRIDSQEKVSYFAQVTADVDSVHDHAWAISIEDLDALRCGQMNNISELPWCSQGQRMTTRSQESFGEKPISLAQWRLVEGQIQDEIDAALQLAPIQGPVLPNLPQQLFPQSIAATASAKLPYCEYPNNYYPALCGVPKQKATDYCAEQAANDNNPHSSSLRARYVKASHQFSFAFTENPMGGCGKYAGSRQVSYYEEMRTGLTGAFARVGPTTTVTANEYDRVRRTMPIPLQCSAPLAGSGVREVVKVSWIPRSGWGTMPTNYSAPLSALPLVLSYDTKVQIVC
jgi:hypothetical protein